MRHLFHSPHFENVLAVRGELHDPLSLKASVRLHLSLVTSYTTPAGNTCCKSASTTQQPVLGAQTKVTPHEQLHDVAHGRPHRRSVCFPQCMTVSGPP